MRSRCAIILVLWWEWVLVGVSFGGGTRGGVWLLVSTASVALCIHYSVYVLEAVGFAGLSQPNYKPPEPPEPTMGGRCIGTPILQEVPKSAPAETLRGSKNGFRAKFGKETVAGAHRRPRWCSTLWCAGWFRACSGCSGSTQDLLRLAQALLRLAQALLRLLTLGSG